MAGPSLLSILEMLPQIIFILQLVMYVTLAWILGSLAFKGMHKKIPLSMQIIGMFGVGFVCLLIGAAIKNFLFFFEGTIFQTIQMDMFLGGVIGSLLLALAFHLITRHEKGAEKSVRKLQERVNLLRGILLKNKVPTLKENEVRKTAETLVPDYTATKTSLKNADWEIFLEKEDKKAVVVMGAYTGEVKKIEHLGADSLLSDPWKIMGVALIIFLVAFSIFNFTGFPSLLESIASFLGMSPDQFGMLTGSTNLPEGCIPTIRLLMKHGISVLGGESSYHDENLKETIERETGRQVVLMYEKDYEGKNYVMSITLPPDMGISDMTNMSNEDVIKNSEICTSTETILCDCIKIPDVNFPTGLIVAV